jgi:tetratricopeptide (TPR) repeat protein
MKTGDEYFDSQEFLDMLASYEQAVNTHQPVLMDADELAEIADYYQMQGQMDNAEAAIKLALSLSPGAIAPLTYRIHEALSLGDIDKAKDYLSQITETDEPEYIYNQAEIMLAEEKVDEADTYLRRVFKTIPPDEYQDYVVDVASIYQDYGYSEKAMQWMARAKQEDSPDFKELMARTLFGLGKYKDSEKLFNELLDTDPFQTRYWNALASVQFMNEDYSSSIQSSEYAIAIDPTDAEGLLSKANGLYRLGNYEEALEYYRRYSDQQPDDEFAWLHQGTCFINLGQNEEACTMLLKAADIAPADSPYLPDIYQELSFAYSELGETDKALDYLNKTDTLDCDHSGIHVVKGHTLLVAGRVEEAEEQFRKALTESNDAPHTLLRIIVSLYDNKYVEAAYKMFQKFFQMVDDDYKDGYAYMALCCYDLQKYDEFLTYLRTACERNPHECRLVLSHIFPNEIQPEDYYEYIKNKIK